MYDYVLEDMFFTVDPDSYVGKEVTFDSYDLDDTYLLRTGRHVGQITFTITGVLCTDSRRDLKENRVDWDLTFRKYRCQLYICGGMTVIWMRIHSYILLSHCMVMTR